MSNRAKLIASIQFCYIVAIIYQLSTKCYYFYINKKMCQTCGASRF